MWLTQLPRQIPMSVYDDVREEVAKRYKDIEGVLAVVESGRVLIPGISDMDFIVIVEPNTPVPVPPLKSYTEQHQYAMSHKHFVISKDTYKNVSYIDPWMRGVTPLVGEAEQWQLPERPFNDEGFNIMSQYFLFVDGIQGFVSDLAYQEAADEIWCHNFLEGIKYIKHYYRELIAAEVVTKEEIDPNIALFESLRDNWFSMDATERTEQANKAFVAIKQTVRTLCDIYTKRVVGDVPLEIVEGDFSPKTKFHKTLLRTYPESLILDMGQEIFIFDPACTAPEVHLQSSRKLPPYFHGDRYTEAIFVFPLALSILQNPLLVTEGPLSEHYRSCCITERKTIPMHPSVPAHTRAQVINDIVKETLLVENVKPLFSTYRYDPNATKHVGLRKQMFRKHRDFTAKLLHGPLGKLTAVNKATVTF